MTAALYLAREGCEVLVIEKAGLGGQSGITQILDNFPGFDEGIAGAEFATQLGRQAKKIRCGDFAGAGSCRDWIAKVNISRLQSAPEIHYHTQALLLATGARYRRMDVPGEHMICSGSTCTSPRHAMAHSIKVKKS